MVVRLANTGKLFHSAEGLSANSVLGRRRGHLNPRDVGLSRCSLNLAVDLGAQKQHQAGNVEPRKQDDYRTERTVCE
jgi:hypothetical protein